MNMLAFKLAQKQLKGGAECVVIIIVVNVYS